MTRGELRTLNNVGLVLIKKMTLSQIPTRSEWQVVEKEEVLLVARLSMEKKKSSVSELENVQKPTVLDEEVEPLLALQKVNQHVAEQQQQRVLERVVGL